MRMRDVLAIAITVGALVVLNPAAARADGGAYMEFDRTHYLPGETATAEAYVYLLQRQQGLLDRGPFYAYLQTGGPAGDIRVGTFQVEQSRPKWFALRVSFTVPDVIGDFYSVTMCNDPCTTRGFKEPIVGYISIVETAREGALLTQNQRLSNRIYALRRTGKKQDKAMAELQGQFDALDRVHSSMAGEMRALEDHLARAAADTREAQSRPLLAPSTGIALVLSLFALAAIIVGRKQRPASAPALGASRHEERRREQRQDQLLLDFDPRRPSDTDAPRWARRSR